MKTAIWPARLGGSVLAAAGLVASLAAAVGRACSLSLAASPAPSAALAGSTRAGSGSAASILVSVDFSSGFAPTLALTLVSRGLVSSSLVSWGLALVSAGPASATRADGAAAGLVSGANASAPLGA